MLLLVEELDRVYSALAAGGAVPATKRKAEYTDFVRWQSDMLAGPEGEQLWTHWRDRLRKPLPTLDLPTDRPRPPVRTSNGATESLTVDPDVANRLAELARAEKTTLFVVLLTTFYALLHRYSNQDDIIVGSPSFGRNRAEYSDVVGPFVNTLSLRADLSGNPSFRALLGQVRQTVLDSINHHDYPIALLVERISPVRDPSRTPLFQTLFNLQKFDRFKGVIGSILTGKHDPAARFGGMKVEPLYIPQQEGQFDLNMEVNELGDELICVLKYNTDLFDAETVRRMLRHYETLLGSVVADAGTRIGELALLSGSEREQFAAWNATTSAYPAQATLPALVTAQAARTPAAVAVRYADETLSYAELEARSNRLARHLQALGVDRGTLVGVALERSPQLLAGLLGILKAGAAYLPLDPSFPQERLAFMLSDAQVPVLLTEQGLRESLPAHAAEVVSLDGDRERIAAQSAAAVETPATAEDLAYVIYTSGSTGRPKGVQIPHRAVVNFLTAMQHEPGLGSEDVLLSVTTLSFDISVLELFLPLVAGAQLVLVSREQAADGEALRRQLEATATTVMQATPTTWRLLIEAGWQGHAGFKALCGGEAWSRDLAEALAARCGSVWNMYGPTETTIWSAVGEVSADTGPVLIGAPIANTQLHVLDGGLQPVPIGVPGELCIGGAGLAHGYLNRAELSAERFVADPFAESPAARLYRTGDLVRRRADGRLEFLGRLDHQVKIRGFRVELGEIEAVLATHPKVAAAVALVREDVPGDQRLVAYLLPDAGQAPSTSELRAFARTRLPDYMVPTAYVELESFPLTPNNKVDRKALPAPQGGRPGRDTHRVAPRNALEETLAGIWEQVLSLEGLGVFDNFFEVGGHSLLATQVVARVRQALQLEMPLPELFAYPTIAALAERVEALRGAAGAREMPPLLPTPRDGPLPLSFAQQRLWFLDQLQPGQTAFNLAGAVQLSGPLDVAALERSVSEIVRRHEVLRTSFVTGDDGQPLQIIAAAADVPLEREDLRSLAAAEREATLQARMNERARQPFDLTVGPLLRATLYALDEDEHVLAMTMNHIVTDGWSFGVIAHELGELYAALVEGRPSTLPALAVQYADFAHWQREWLRGEVLDEQLGYWKERLGGEPPVLQLPTDRPRPAVQ
ncbi:MAG TPA: amino acid adenylation domain-containing protein, partial [Woeseiaceae bacterium]|nr:amino acid adenylation domain-containing protein [Woeseiaceae bacterium]